MEDDEKMSLLDALKEALFGEDEEEEEDDEEEED